MTCFWCTFGFGKCFGASLQYNRWGGGCHLSYNIHFSSHVTVRLRNDSLLLCTIREGDTSKGQFFLTCSQLMRHPFNKLYHLSSLLQMPEDCRMVNTEFFGSFSGSCKRISFSDPLSWSLPASNGRPLHSSSSRLSSPLQNFLNYHCTVLWLAVPGLNALLMLWVVSDALWPILNSNKKIAQICSLSHIISKININSK